MSFAKRLLEKQEDQWRIATDIAIEAGVLKKCEFHEYVYDDGEDPTPAYKLGNYTFSAGKLNGVFDTRVEMTDAIKGAIEDAGVDCVGCTSERED